MDALEYRAYAVLAASVLSGVFFSPSFLKISIAYSILFIFIMKNTLLKLIY